MSHREFLPPGFNPVTWDSLSLYGRLLVEAGIYDSSVRLNTRRLYAEHLIAEVDPSDLREPGTRDAGANLPRLALKLFLQFLKQTAVSAYARRVCAAAEGCGMDLSVVEDSASLYFEQERRKGEA